MEQQKRKTKRIGQVWKRKDGKGKLIVLGSEKEKDPKYNFTVELVVKDAEGKVLVTKTNTLLSLFDVSADVKTKVPMLLADISVTLDEAAGASQGSFRKR